MNYWLNFSECEKKMYELIVLAEKDITHEVLMNIFNANFDINKSKNESLNSNKAEENYFFSTHNTGIENSQICSDIDTNMFNPPAFSYDTVQQMHAPSFPQPN